jgi:hypothetical protein
MPICKKDLGLIHGEHDLTYAYSDFDLGVCVFLEDSEAAADVASLLVFSAGDVLGLPA